MRQLSVETGLVVVAARHIKASSFRVQALCDLCVTLWGPEFDKTGEDGVYSWSGESAAEWKLVEAGPVGTCRARILIDGHAKDGQLYFLAKLPLSMLTCTRLAWSLAHERALYRSRRSSLSFW